MTDKQNPKNSDIGSLVAAYEVTMSWYRKGERLGHYTQGYYAKKEDAQAVVNRKRERNRSFESGKVIPIRAVRIGEKYYELSIQVPNEAIAIVKPSELENIVREIVALDIGNKQVVIVYSSPIKVKEGVEE